MKYLPNLLPKDLTFSQGLKEFLLLSPTALRCYIQKKANTIFQGQEGVMVDIVLFLISHTGLRCQYGAENALDWLQNLSLVLPYFVTFRKLITSSYPKFPLL